MLTIEKLEVPGLAPVSLDIKQGTCITLQASSGTGKSLLLRAIADLDPASGEVRFNASQRSATTGPEWREKVRYFAAEPGFWGAAVGDHFTNADTAINLLDALGLPGDVLTWTIQRLSTGEKQRIALARGLEDHPPVLLLDEPTAALDTGAVKQAEALLKGRLKAGACAILVTHDKAQAKRMAKRHFTIRDGVLVEQK